MRLDRFWVVVMPTKASTLPDICMETDIAGLERQFRGGLAAKMVVGAFTEQQEADDAAKSLLRRRSGAIANLTDYDRRVMELLWDAITDPRLRDRASALLKELMGEK